jgi:hypothetical protein
MARKVFAAVQQIECGGGRDVVADLQGLRAKR